MSVGINSEFAERCIRGMAATVVNQAQTRIHHPSYGVTKTAVRAEYNRMEGAIGLYMAMTGQANHTGVPFLAEFAEPKTEEIVREARRVANSI